MEKPNKIMYQGEIYVRADNNKVKALLDKCYVELQDTEHKIKKEVLPNQYHIVENAFKEARGILANELSKVIG